MRRVLRDSVSSPRERELGWDGQALHLYTFTPSFSLFFVHCRCRGGEREGSYLVCLVLGRCSGGIFSSGIFHVHMCPEVTLCRVYFNEWNYHVQASFHSFADLRFTYFTLMLFALCSCVSARDLQISWLARWHPSGVTSLCILGAHTLNWHRTYLQAVEGTSKRCTHSTNSF